MTTFLIILVTVLLVLDCLLLGLLIMIQLPKKEAGIGMAFGGGAADALFGAGSGTALSNLTKYTAAGFFILVFVLSLLNNHSRSNGSELGKAMEKINATSTQPATPPPANNNNSSAGALGVPPLTTFTNTPPPTSTPPTTAPAKSGPTATTPAQTSSTNNAAKPK